MKTVLHFQSERVRISFNSCFLCNFLQISTVNKQMDDIKTERDGLMSEKAASGWASSQEEELQCRLTSLRQEKEEMSALLEMVKQEEQQLRTEMKCRLVALQTEVSSSVGLQPDGLSSVSLLKSDTK